MLRQLQVIIGIWKMHKHHKYEHISALFVWASLPGHRNNNGQPIMWVWGTTFFLSDQFQNAGWFWKIIRKIQEIIVIRKSRKRWWWWERTGKKQEREPGSNFRTNSPLVSAANELWGAAAGRMPVRWRRSGGMGRRREGTAPEGAWQPSPYTQPPPQRPTLALSPSATAFSRHLHYSKINALSILCLHTLDMCAALLPVLPRVSHPCCPQDMPQMKSNGCC